MLHVDFKGKKQNLFGTEHLATAMKPEGLLPMMSNMLYYYSKVYLIV